MNIWMAVLSSVNLNGTYQIKPIIQISVPRAMKTTVEGPSSSLENEHLHYQQTPGMNREETERYSILSQAVEIVGSNIKDVKNTFQSIGANVEENMRHTEQLLKRISDLNIEIDDKLQSKMLAIENLIQQMISCVKEKTVENESEFSLQSLADEVKHLNDKLFQLTQVVIECKQTSEKFTNLEETRAASSGFSEALFKDLCTLRGIVSDIDNKCQKHTQALAEITEEKKQQMLTIKDTMTAASGFTDDINETRRETETLIQAMKTIPGKVCDIDNKCQEHTEILHKFSKQTNGRLSSLEARMPEVNVFSENIKETKTTTEFLFKDMETLTGQISEIGITCQKHTQALAENAKETKATLSTLGETKAELSGFVDNINESKMKTEALVRDMGIFQEQVSEIDRKCQEHIQDLGKNAIENREKFKETKEKLSTLGETMDEQYEKHGQAFSLIRIWLFIISLLLSILIVKDMGVHEIARSIEVSSYLWPTDIPDPIENDAGMTVNKHNDFDFNVKQIKQDFPSETDRFWSSVFAPIYRVIQEDDPSRPAVILIATTRSTRTVAECLSRKVATIVEALYDLIPGKSDPYLTLEAQELKASSSDEARSDMETALNNNFDQGHMVAVIHDLGSLPPEVAALLHAYCDHESAHYRKAVILATAYLEPEMTLTVGAVEAYLLNTWEKLGIDLLKPLLSRVGNNIAIVSRDNTIDQCNPWQYLWSLVMKHYK